MIARLATALGAALLVGWIAYVLDVPLEEPMIVIEDSRIADAYATLPPATTTTTTLELIEPPVPTTTLAAATVAATAERGTQLQVTETLPPPPLVGLWGMPLAPEGLERCEELSFYRSQAGLIPYFDGVGFRESSCRNDVSSFCCHGYFQIYVSLSLRDHFLAPRFEECEIDSIEDVLSGDDDSRLEDGYKKQRNACAAVAIYDYQGGGAWDAW